ncbi:MAG TPA: hypothetical protein VJZ94_00330 [Candidatus Paceibacterota bacterium]|nr:hypothetical protein [Candidatus Paceibacterota bacterium]
MKWIGISGTWKITSKEVEADVRKAVREIIERGDGIVTGGALNVDYFATDEAFKINPEATRIKICLPATLERYAAHYRKRSGEEVVTLEQAENLIAQLTALKNANPQALIEHPTNTVINQVTYFERNSEVVELSDELLAFQVNDSLGVQDTVDKAKALGKPVIIKKYAV